MIRALVVLLASSTALAADRYVEVTGSDASNDCTVAVSPCATLYRALTQASSGDDVMLGAGSFSGTSNGLYVQSGVDVIGMGSDITVLHDGGADQALRYSAGGTQTLSGLTISATQNAVDLQAWSSVSMTLLLEDVTIQADGNAFNMAGSANVALQSMNGHIEAYDAYAVEHGWRGVHEVLSQGTIYDLGGSAITYSATTSSAVSFNAVIDDFSATTGNYLVQATVAPQTLWNATLSNGTVEGGGLLHLSASSSADAHAWIDHVDLTQDSPSDVVSLYGEGADMSLVLRDVSIDGADQAIDVFGEGNFDLLLDRLTVSNSYQALWAEVTSADLDLDLRDIDISGLNNTAITLLVSGSEATMRARGGSITDVGDAFELVTIDGTHGDFLIDGMTLSNNSTGVLMYSSSSSSGANLQVHRSTFADNQKGMEIQGNVFISKSRIVDHLTEGIEYYSPPAGGNLVLRNNFIANNADNYAYSGGYDVLGIDYNASGATISAADNWWGTTDPALIDAHVSDPLDDPDYMDVTYTALGSDLSFEVYPPYGTPSATELLIERTPGSPPLIEFVGSSPMTVTIGGVPAEIIGGSRDGQWIRVARGEMAPGTYDVTISDPHGHEGIAFGAHTIDEAIDTVDYQHQPWLQWTGTWTRIEGPPFSTARLFLSAAADGPRHCPPYMGGDCLQIPGPIAVDRFFSLGPTGIAWVRVGPAAATQPEYVSAQVVLLNGGDFLVSPPSTDVWLHRKDDHDLDGADNGQEHSQGTDPLRADSDGDGCLDDIDISRNFHPVDDRGYGADCSR